MQSLFFSNLAPILGLPAWLSAASRIDTIALGVVAVFVVLVILMRFILPKSGAIAWGNGKRNFVAAPLPHSDVGWPLWVIYFSIPALSYLGRRRKDCCFSGIDGR